MTTQTAAEQPAPNTAAQMQDNVVQQLSQLTISLVQQREELARQERMAESLQAEITQRRLKIAADSEDLLRLQGAATALQQLTKEQSS